MKDKRKKTKMTNDLDIIIKEFNKSAGVKK